MLTENVLPSLGHDLVRIHKVITRGLTIGVKKGTEFMQAGFPDLAMQQGFAIYTRSLTIVLDAHHLAEDEVAFPALQKKLPLAPYERLSATHKEIEALLAPASQAVTDLAGPDAGASLGLLVDGLRKITALWAPHIRMEESLFSVAALSEVMAPEEQARLSGAMGKHSQEHAAPPYLALPFVLFNLAGEDRASIAATLPGTVMDDLIMKAWKDQWAPMKPFLLE
jgi:hypothetical protein